MKQKNLKRKFGKAIGQWVYLKLKNLQEGQKVLAAGMRYGIDKDFNISISHSDLLAHGNRQYKHLKAEGKFIRHIWGQGEHGNREILGWEYGISGEENKAKNTGEIIIQTRPVIGWMKRLQIICLGGLHDRALNDDGKAIAKIFTGNKAEKIIDKTGRVINKVILLPSETRKQEKRAP